jgi:hypothetical protein
LANGRKYGLSAYGKYAYSALPSWVPMPPVSDIWYPIPDVSPPIWAPITSSGVWVPTVPLFGGWSGPSFALNEVWVSAI